MTPTDRSSIHTRSLAGPGWAISHYACVASTQELARLLPPWSAVWADEQTAGRGQADRTFVSDPGGIYLTAVLPYDGDALAAKGFALAVGWALCTALRKAGVKTARLRWPNDLIVGAVKVGGILVEQGGPGALLVGVGLNLTNRPWETDTTLRGVAGCLADTSAGFVLPERVEWMHRLLESIRLAYEEFGCRRLDGMIKVLHDCWADPREVILEPARGVTLAATCGQFLGIDARGAVRLRTGPGVETRVPAHHIHRLREVW